MQRDQIKWLFPGDPGALQPQTCDSSPQNFAARNFQNIFLTTVQTVAHLFSSFLCAVTSLPLISSFWWSSINWVSQKQPMTTLLINGHFMGLEMSSNLQSKELTELKRSLTFIKYVLQNSIWWKYWLLTGQGRSRFTVSLTGAFLDHHTLYHTCKLFCKLFWVKSWMMVGLWEFFLEGWGAPGTRGAEVAWTRCTRCRLIFHFGS